MAWVVDTSVLLDIHSADPVFSRASASCLALHLRDGLVVCPVSYVELAPAFLGDTLKQEAFLRLVGVSYLASWTRQDTLAAHRLWADHIKQKRAGHGNRRPMADVLIEAYTQRFQGIITRNPKHFTTVPVTTP